MSRLRWLINKPPSVYPRTSRSDPDQDQAAKPAETAEENTQLPSDFPTHLAISYFDPEAGYEEDIGSSYKRVVHVDGKIVVFV